MDKSPDAFRTISEVAEWLGVQAHVLRFWESKFSQVKPVKRAGGRRYYRPADMELLGGIKKLLHDDGLTVKGVQKILSSEGVTHVSALSPDLGDDSKVAVLEREDDQPSEAESTATVVPFKSAQPESEPSKGATPEPETAEHETQETASSLPKFLVSEPKAAPEIADPALADPEADADHASEPDSDPSEEDSTPDPSITSDQIIAAPPDAPSVSAKTSPPDEKPILPSFLHRAAPEPAPPPPPPQETQADPVDTPLTETPTEPTPDQDRIAESASILDTEPDGEPVPDAEPATAQTTMIVDAPDPPAETELSYSQGPLAHLADLGALSNAQAAEIAPLVAQLQAWVSRASDTAAR